MTRISREKTEIGIKGGVSYPSPQVACFGIPYTLGKRKAIRFLTSLSRMETLPVRLIPSDVTSSQKHQFQRQGRPSIQTLLGWVALVALALVQNTRAEELPKAIDLFPETTQAFASLPNSAGFLKN